MRTRLLLCGRRHEGSEHRRDVVQLRCSQGSSVGKRLKGGGREPCIQAAEEGGWNSVGARVRRNEILGIFFKNRQDFFTG